jgi:hypothetical protein
MYPQHNNNFKKFLWKKYNLKTQHRKWKKTFGSQLAKQALYHLGHTSNI